MIQPVQWTQKQMPIFDVHFLKRFQILKIIVSQRISSIQDSDRIIVLNEGKIDGIGTHEELLENNEIYNEVYNSASKRRDNH